MSRFIRRRASIRRRRSGVVPGKTGGITGTLSATLDTITLSAASTIRITGTLSATLDTITLSSAGTVRITGTLSQSLATITLASASTVLIKGTLSATLDTIVLSATGAVKIQGALSTTLDSIALSAASGVRITGSLTTTLDDMTSSLASELLPIPGGHISGGTFSRGRWRSIVEERERKKREAELAAEGERHRILEMALAKSLDERAKVRARWLQEDAIANAAAYDRLSQGAMAALYGASSAGSIAPHAGMIRAMRDADEEEEAITLLLMDD